MQLVSLRPWESPFSGKSSQRSLIMTCIDVGPASRQGAASTSSSLPRASANWLGRAWTYLKEALASPRGYNSLLRLNDHLLRDIGQTRADIEYEAMFWPRRRAKPPRPSAEDA
jgi:uncharacterized protein YjiS (DUF1127 family)